MGADSTCHIVPLCHIIMPYMYLKSCFSRKFIELICCCSLLQVMPILKLLYNADNHNAHHIYMSLIILLILSQDDNFNKSVHELVRIM